MMLHILIIVASVFLLILFLCLNAAQSETYDNMLLK